jgi:hypothetical protein
MSETLRQAEEFLAALGRIREHAEEIARLEAVKVGRPGVDPVLEEWWQNALNERARESGGHHLQVARVTSDGGAFVSHGDTRRGDPQT